MSVVILGREVFAIHVLVEHLCENARGEQDAEGHRALSYAGFGQDTTFLFIEVESWIAAFKQLDGLYRLLDSDRPGRFWRFILGGLLPSAS